MKNYQGRSLLDKISIHGLYLRWSKDFLSSPFNVKFTVTRVRDAVDYIVENMVTRAASRMAWCWLSVNGRDYK